MTWRTILVLGAVASAAAVGCTVTATAGNGDGGGPDSGSGATTETGGKAGSGGSSGSGGTKANGGTGGGAAGKAGGGMTDAGMKDAPFDTCSPDKTKMCDNCIQTKCCTEWLACANDKDCLRTVGGKDPEFTCVQLCLIGPDGGSVATVEDCAGMCQHESAGVSIATSELIACMRDKMDDAGPQNCTQECFNRDLPVK